MKRVAIFGSTGAIGQRTIQVIEHLEPGFRISALVARRNVARLAQQARRYRPSLAVITEPGRLDELRRALRGSGVQAREGTAGMEEAAGDSATDILVMGISGTQGLQPMLTALRLGKRIALATKEIIVSYGRIVMSVARRCRAEILPIDSELSAIHQCLEGHSQSEVTRILLTASGGPFFRNSALSRITVRQALAHPTWRMGRKITVDSATMIDKGLEVIEAAAYFGINPERIEVLVHPQSIVHSLVEFVDGSMLAQLAKPDMRLPIQYALTYPQRLPGMGLRARLEAVRNLTFHSPDMQRFPSLGLAYQALRQGGIMPCVLNAANEVAVQAFLNRRLAFDRIPAVVAWTMHHLANCRNPGLAQLQSAEREALRKAREACERMSQGR